MITSGSKSIGERIRVAREKKALNIEDLAKKACCSSEYLEWVIIVPFKIFKVKVTGFSRRFVNLGHPNVPSGATLRAHRPVG